MTHTASTHRTRGVQPRRTKAEDAQRLHVAEIAIITVAILALAIAAAFPAIQRAVYAERPRIFSQVKVRSGESVWSLAKRNPVPGYSTAELVEVIRAENALDGALVAGDVVRVPVREFNDAAVCQK